MNDKFRHIRFGSLSLEDRLMVYGASRISLYSSEGTPGFEYLTRIRGLDLRTIADFRLGFVPFTVDHPFAGRVVMPIFDQHDDLLALSVRGVRDDCEPKYWNESYPKGENLFGFANALDSIIRWGFAILVEGQFDVISMHSRGLTNVVGVLGGAFTPMHAHILRRWTRQIVFAFDGDPAGRGHLEKAVELLSVYNSLDSNLLRPPLSHAVIRLTNDQDPDDYVKANGAIQARRMISGVMDAAGLKPSASWRAGKERNHNGATR